MTANPLMKRFAEAPLDPQLRLEGLVARLNGTNWVRGSGRFYFIGERERADGSVEHFLDRAI